MVDFAGYSVHRRENTEELAAGRSIWFPQGSRLCGVLLPISNGGQCLLTGRKQCLRELKERTDSRWMFPSPVKEDAPLDPQSVYRKMKKVLARAQCKDIRFHDLRHTFAATALAHGMDVKTLSALCGPLESVDSAEQRHAHQTGSAKNAEKIPSALQHAGC